MDSALAQVEFVLEQKNATISVYNKIKPRKFETVVIHELLHLHFIPFTKWKKTGSVAQTVEEQSVNAITKALKRGSKFGKKTCNGSNY